MGIVTAESLKGRYDRFKANKSISEANKRAILNFINSKSHTKFTTRDTYLTRLSRLSYFKKRDFKTLKNHDFNKYLIHLDENFGQRTYNGDVVVCKGFFSWLGNAEAVKDAKKKNNIPKKHQAGDLINYVELKRLLDACRNIRDRCFIHLLWETASRIGEIQYVKLKDIQEAEEGWSGFLLQIRQSKTEPRPCHIIEAKDDLAAWLQQHPNKSNPEAYLFQALRVKRNAPLSYSTIRGVLDTIVKDAKIKKYITPHIFRKSRSTYLSVVKRWPNPLIEKSCGWAEGSTVLNTYVRLSNEDVLNQKLLDCGMSEEKKEENMWKCLYCNHVNSAAEKRCHQCKKSPTTARAILEKNATVEGELDVLNKKFEQLKVWAQQTMNKIATEKIGVHKELDFTKAEVFNK